MSYQQTGTPQETVPQNDQGDGETNVRPAGCQRIHWEAGEVCDIFIPDFWEEGIKHLSQINAQSVIKTNKCPGYYLFSLQCERHYCDRGENIL